MHEPASREGARARFDRFDCGSGQLEAEVRAWSSFQQEELTTTPFQTDVPITPLRQRMQQDMVMRGLGSHSQQDYVRHVRNFAAFLGRPPDTATAEDIL